MTDEYLLPKPHTMLMLDEPYATLTPILLLDNGQASYPMGPGRVVGLVQSIDSIYAYDNGQRSLVTHTKLWALVAKTDNETIATLTHTLEELRKSAREACSENGEAQRDLAALHKEHTAKLKELQDTNVLKEQLARSCEREFERFRKVESDLAKVKKHFGEKAFAEALAK